ncbi:MAG TPA: PfkB family carbohydrate kinase [Candidatus Binatia bacterium]|nr:PfkB family carbohydrate kinase [Candidatus Binatia bacterium]
MSIVVVGSVFFDTVETPHGKVEDVMGGAATYFAVAASFFTPVKMVATAGEDFPASEIDFLTARNIDLNGLQLRPGKTGRWAGRYHEDMNVRDTLDLQLNVFADFKPALPASYRDAQYVFLANIDPALQSTVLDQLAAPGLIGCDTMNHWIVESRPDVERLLGRVDILTINDEEARLLSGERNLVKAARRILAMGPKSVLIKRGEYGVIRFAPDSVFAIPAFPLEEVFDPTGAGDTFAGGFMGEIARSGDTSEASLRRAIVYGSVMASFCVEDFSLNRLRSLTHDDIEHRYRQFVSLTDIAGV